MHGCAPYGHAGKVTRVGNAGAALFGFDPAMLLGKSITSFIDCLAPPEGGEAREAAAGGRTLAR